MKLLPRRFTEVRRIRSECVIIIKNLITTIMIIIGKTIGGHYYIISSVGKGGFGETYLVQDEHLPDKPPRVVKRFKPQSNDPFLLQEAKRLF